MSDNLGLVGADLAHEQSKYDPDELLTCEEAAVVLRHARITLEQWRRKGQGPAFIRIERSVRYRRGDLMDYLRACTVRHTDKFAS